MNINAVGPVTAPTPSVLARSFFKLRTARPLGAPFSVPPTAIALFIMLFFSVMPAFAAEWQELRGDHFITFYKSDEEFARQVAHKAETAYKRIAEDLGYARYSNFWQWDSRVKIYIYDSESDFKKMTGQPGWSEGMANYTTKQIHALNRGEGFIDGILPHEITHLIFRDFVGLEGEIPLWMDEGVAQWEEPMKRAMSKKIARYLVATGKDFHTQDLMMTDVRTLQDEEKVHNFYMQSVSLVDYLVKSYGGQSFTEFCRALRDGKKFEEALRSAYPNSIENVNDLDTKWREYASKEDI